MTYTTPSSRRQLCALLGATLLLCLHPGAHAQTSWPAKPIRAVVGFAPGGGVDTMARTVSQPLADLLGQAVVVDNKPGGSGNTSAADVMRAPADGYTILFAPLTQQTVNPYVMKGSPDMAKNMTPVAIVGRNKLHLVVKKDLPVRSVKELIELARAQPGKLNYSSSGIATSPHLLGELFLKQTGVNMVHVPYKGSAPAMQSVLAGETDLVFDPGLAFQHVQAGNMKLLAVASDKRPSAFPNVPTMAEEGFPAITFDAWTGIWVPTGTPPEVIDKLSRSLQTVLSQPAVMQRFEGLNAEARYRNVAEFRAMLDSETKTLSAIIKERNISLD
ncbi:MAG: tripartite tricarboxylate transporter substrate binding protein [Burkholderiales bacterium]|nr:MAG: tripartite tricarboxylate transporter substrate binding protein [Burkholderiales bacterium]